MKILFNSILYKVKAILYIGKINNLKYLLSTYDNFLHLSTAEVTSQSNGVMTRQKKCESIAIGKQYPCNPFIYNFTVHYAQISKVKTFESNFSRGYVYNTVLFVLWIKVIAPLHCPQKIVAYPPIVKKCCPIHTGSCEKSRDGEGGCFISY